MADTLVCWKCGAPIAGLPLPVARTAECAACRADLHACRMCEYYDVRAALSCREPVAEEVQDKERANFCGYFSARARPYGDGVQAAAAARAQLDALFGGGPSGTGADKGGTVTRSQADAAREQLERLFSSRGKGEI